MRGAKGTRELALHRHDARLPQSVEDLPRSIAGGVKHVSGLQQPREDIREEGGTTWHVPNRHEARGEYR